MRFARSCCIPIILLSSCILVQAQDRAAVNGTVTDATGAVVANADVDLRSEAIGVHRTGKTSSTGFYQFPALGVGRYVLTIKKEGFRPFTVLDIDLQFAQTQTLDAKLQVGATSETVEVEAVTDALNTSNAEVGTVIDTTQIQELPISGRNWASLMLLAQGAVNYGDGAQRAIRFNGHSLDDSNFTFDGIDTSGVQEQTQKADTRLNIAMDSIAEFRVSTAEYTAEVGSAGGAQINVVSKSGTNQYHGERFYAIRDDALDSRSPFDGSEIPPFRLHQFGGNFGGAIVKDKAFFFANYEGLRQNLGQTLINFVPNEAYRAQVLAKSPVLKPIMDAYPIGQIPIDDITDQVTSVATDTMTRKRRHVPVRLSLHGQRHGICPVQHRQRIYRRPAGRAGHAQRDPAHSDELCAAVPTHLLSANDQRGQIRRQSGELSQLDVRHGAGGCQPRAVRFRERHRAGHRGWHDLFVHRQHHVHRADATRSRPARRSAGSG